MDNISLYSLASGSSGNSFLIKNSNTMFLIDAGLSCKRTEQKFNELNLNIQDLKGIVITHTHGDHISGVGPIVRRYSIPVYISEKSYNFARKKLGRLGSVNFIKGPFTIDNFLIDPFVSPHDSIETLNFIIKTERFKMAYVSDTGYVTELLLYKVDNPDVLIIEANYDKKLLIESNERPWPVKQRIMSRGGHLSNEDTFSILRKINIDRLKYLFLIHISEDHNEYGLVYTYFNNNISKILKKELEILVCKQNEIKGIEIC